MKIRQKGFFGLDGLDGFQIMHATERQRTATWIGMSIALVATIGIFATLVMRMPLIG